MQYRTLPHGGEQISILGLGTSSIQFAEEKEIEGTVCRMMWQSGWSREMPGNFVCAQKTAQVEERRSI